MKKLSIKVKNKIKYSVYKRYRYIKSVFKKYIKNLNFNTIAKCFKLNMTSSLTFKKLIVFGLASYVLDTFNSKKI